MTKTLRVAALVAATLAPMAAPATAQNEPEVTDITIGLPVHNATFLPVYLAQSEGYFEDEGLSVEIVAFRGGTDLVRGMVAGAVEVGVTSLAGVNVGIKAGQPLKAFYGGFNMAPFDWYAVEGISSFEEAEDARFGVTRVGSSTDYLTRYALEQAGMDPEEDVQIVQGGGSPERLAAMNSGQIDVNIFAAPEKFMAEEQGYTMILGQSDIAQDYPNHVFFSTEDFLAESPNTIRAILRGFVRGVRLGKSDEERAVQEIMEREGMTEEYARLSYEDSIGETYADGRLPSVEGMQAFWEMGIMAGEYEEPWEQERFFDSTFVDSFDEWAPQE